MARRTRNRGSVPLRVAVAAAVAMLAGCSTTYGTTSPMGRVSGPMGGVSGPMGGAGAGVGGMRAGSAGGAPVAAPLSCSAPTDLPGERVTVTLADMGLSRMMGGIAPMGARMLLGAQPAAVRTGELSLVVENTGWRTHEVVILPLAVGASAGRRVPGADGTVDETGSLGEASSSCAAGEGEGIASGAVGWVTVTLPPGHYELVCNLRNHYANGMRQELVVTG